MDVYTEGCILTFKVKKLIRPAIFLDRDGTLTKRQGVTLVKSQLRLQRGASRLIHFINSLGLPVVVITNQGSVARGHITLRGVRNLHRHVHKLLEKKGARIDAFYFCPHHPTEGVIKRYRVICSCRKPRTGLFKRAAKDLDLDLRKSVMIGDTTLDIMAGKHAGMKTVLVKTGHKGQDRTFDVKADYTVTSLTALRPLLDKIYKKTWS